jgi:hypothetical protein
VNQLAVIRATSCAVVVSARIKGLVMLLLAGFIFGACEGADWRDFSIDATKSKAGSETVRKASHSFLSLVTSIGTGFEGLQPTQVSDVGLGNDGSVFILDAGSARVRVFSPDGTPKGTIGEAGASAGSLLGPSRLVVFDSTLAVHDARTGLMSVYTISGKFVRSFALPGDTRTLPSMVRGAVEGEFLVLVRDTVGYRVESYDQLGQRTAVYLTIPDARPGGRKVRSPPGSICARDSSAISHLNPWLYEIATADRGRGLRSATRYRAEAFTPVEASAANGNWQPRAIPIGLLCTAEYDVLAFLDRLGPVTRVYYDFHPRGSSEIVRLEYSQVADSLYPGFLADQRNGLIATFRTRPNTRVFVFRFVNRKR